MIEIKIDDREVRKLLDGIKKRAEDMSPVMRRIAGKMRDAVEENFAQEGRPRWKRSKRAEREGGKTLQDTRQLNSSISEKSDSHSAAVGTNKVYAAIQQFGGKAGRGKKVTIPARPFLMIQEEDWEGIKQALKKYLMEK